MLRPPIAPSFVSKNVDKTYEYFTEVLGFAGLGKWMGPDGKPMHAMVALPTKLGDAMLMFGPYEMAANAPESGEFGRNLPKGPLGNGVVLWFNVPDVDKYHAFVEARGATIDEAPKDQFWGDRTMSVLAPDGYYLTFAAPIKGFQPGPGMDAPPVGVKQATAPLTKKLKLPGPPAKARKAAKAPKAAKAAAGRKKKR